MNVDKFGRSSGKEKGLKGPKGDGFKLTKEGDYDIQKKRLRNVDDPTDGLDAINLRTWTSGLLNCMTIQDESFDAQGKRLCNLDTPKEVNDAVTVDYVRNITPIKLEGIQAYSVHQYRIQDVAIPEFDGDAVNLSYFRKNTLTQDANGIYNAENQIIRNVAPPSNGSDAVNKAYLERQVPTQTDRVWSFKNKRLSQVGAPTHVHDVVTINYLRNNSLSLDAERDWNARGKRITNVTKPNGLSDAVNKRFVKEAITDLAFTLYKELNKGKRTTEPDPAEWKENAMKDTSTWDEVFK